MRGVGRTAKCDLPSLPRNGNCKKHIELRNVARVREYLTNNLGCTRKEVIHALGLNSRTVAKAIQIIRSQA
jgi:hypothetical protein